MTKEVLVSSQNIEETFSLIEGDLLEEFFNIIIILLEMSNIIIIQ